MIPEIKTNILNEIRMAKEIASLFNIQLSSKEEERLVNDAVISLGKRIKILNKATNDLIEAISVANPLVAGEKKLPVERINIHGTGESVAVRTKDRDRYLDELSISSSLLKKLKLKKVVVEKEDNYKKANFYAQFSNKFFFDVAQKWLENGSFKDLNIDLRKANMNFLTATYVSMMILSTIFALIGGVILTVLFLFVNIGLQSPFISAYTGNYLTRLGIVIWIAVALPAITFVLFYFYPSMERRSLTQKIEGELPFVVIHMGSIAGSGVEPSHIFKIVGLSNDYPATRTEIRKLLNQVNVYGYDLITALKNVSRLTPSPRLAEVFNGLATTISSGGDLKTFFEKRAETLLLQYRIEREKFTKVAETFMDLYISVVIAAPMILLLLLIMISVSGVSTGLLSQDNMTFIILSVVGLINVIFLWVIGLKQPSY